MFNNHGLIIHKTSHKKGRTHDYAIYDKNRPVIPHHVVNVFDLACVGVEKDFPDLKSSMPNRKKRKQGLSQEEKDYNHNHSKKRMVIGHTICRLKRYRMMSDVFRNKLRKCNRVSGIASGLVNYRTMYRHY